MHNIHMQIKQRDAILYTYSGNNEDKAWWTNLNIAILINYKCW